MANKRKLTDIPDVGDAPHQPKNFKFPRRSFGKANVSTRPFQENWFSDHRWIHYDESNDKAFCYVCIKAYKNGCISNNNLEPRFISEGYTNWKEATRTGRGFPGHENSNCHKEAVERTVSLPKCTENIGESLSAIHAAEKAVARQALLKILSNVRVLSRQALPLRGDKKDEPNSNFIQMYKLRAEDHPFLLDWMKRKGDKYMSADIQNEMMKIMALRILREIAGNIGSAEFFTIMADEATDVANVSQLVLCIRWVDDELNTYEDFIGLHSLDEMNANMIVRVIKDVLLRMNISLQKCRGQCYDGCSTMTGEKSGVAKQIKDIQPKALFTHCFTHALNLAVGDCIKASRLMKNALGTAYEVTKLVKKSPKRDAKLKELKNNIDKNSDEGSTTNITLLCPTRWTVRAKSLRSIIDNFEDLMTLWEWSLDNCNVSDITARVRGVKKSMKSFDYFFGSNLGELILGHSDNLSKTLQNPKLSAVEGRGIAMATVETLKKLREDASFDLFWSKVLKHGKQLGVKDPKQPRQKNQPKTLTDYVGYGPTREVEHDTVKDLYRRHYYTAFDSVINCIEARFNQNDFRIYASSEQVLLKAATGKDYESELKDVLQFYTSDIDEMSLRSQLQTFSTNFQSTSQGTVNFKDIVSYLQGLSTGMKSLLSEVLRFTKLILVAGATNATSERSFSAMRRAKSYLQSTMGQVRLNNIMVLHVHKELTDKLNLVDVANDFVQGSEHRLSFFGTFQEVDKRRGIVHVKTKATQTQSCDKN